MNNSEHDSASVNQASVDGQSAVRSFVYVVAALLTGILCSLAIVQLSGRLALAYANALTPHFNTALAPYQTHVTELAGDWRGFNPVLRVQRLSFAAGNLQDLYIELDFFQSLAKWKPIFRRFYSANGEVAVVYTPQGWALKNSSEQPIDVDFLELLNSSEFVDATLRLVAERADGAFGYDIELIVDNRPANKQGRLVIDSPGSSKPLVLAYGETTKISDEPVSDHALRLTAEGVVEIPAALNGGTALTLELPRAQWLASAGPQAIDHADEDPARADAPQGYGVFSATLQVTQSPYLRPDNSLTLGLQGTVWAQGALTLARLQSNLQAQGSQRLELPPMLLEVDADRLLSTASSDRSTQHTSPAVRIRTTDLALGAFSELAGAILSEDKTLGEWLVALDARATLQELIGRYSPSSGLDWWGRADAVQLSAYRGSPEVNNARAQIYGDLNHIGMRVEGENVTMRFPTVFSEAWRFDAVSGDLLLLFRPGYASVRGSNIAAVDGNTRISGGFATSRPTARFDQRISLGLQVDAMTVPQTERYIPYKLNPGLRQWLFEAPIAGDFGNISVAHHGQIHIRPGEVTRRRFELQGDFQGAQILYESQWPMLVDAGGSIHVAGRQTYGVLQAGKSAGLDLAGAAIHVDANQSMLFLSHANTAAGNALLAMVRQSPLKQSLSFITPQWRADGELAYVAQIGIPLGSAPPPTAKLQVDIEAEFDQLDLAMPEYRLAWRNLAGQQRFSLPHNLQGDANGLLFGNPVGIRVDYDLQHLMFEVAGRASALDVFRVAGTESSSMLEGTADFNGKLLLAMGTSAPAELMLTTDLEGMKINLPAQFGKTHSERSASVFDLTFADDYLRLDWQYKSTDGWYEIPSGPSQRVIQGAIGVNAQPLEIEPEYDGLVISGQLAAVDLVDWVAKDGGAAVDLPMNWQIRGLQVGDFIVDDLSFANLTLSGQGDSSTAVFQVRSEDIAGSIDLSDPSRPEFDLLTLRLPGTGSGETALRENLDPIDLAVGRGLPRAKVFVNELMIDKAPFGRWKFEIYPESGGVRFDIEDVLVNGVDIKDSVIHWNLEQNRSAFSGAVHVQDLAEVLPQWGYAPVVTSKAASVVGNLSWAGSPANLNLAKSEGGVSLRAEEGSFLELDGGQAGLRVVSLLNITALTKRMAFDFSDVVGEGIRFEEAFGDVQLEDQKLSFTKNLVIESTSSRYEFGGEVDLGGNTLDGEMIVTLPVSDSLPWYAAYLALANPLAGLGLAVGERVFRKPIEQMSSAKFVVSGALDDPEVTFTELFNKDIKEVDVAGERLSPDLLKDQRDEDAVEASTGR